MASERKVGQPIPPKKMERVAELIGMGLSHSETAGAAGVSERTVQRILAKPEYRKMADDVKKRRTSVTVQAASVVQELLGAVKHNGEPDMAARQRGAELVMKNPTLLEHVEELDGDEAMLPGVVLRFPWSLLPEYSRESGGGEASEAISAPGAESENGLTLPPDAEAEFAAIAADGLDPDTEDDGLLVGEAPPADLDTENAELEADLTRAFTEPIPDPPPPAPFVPAQEPPTPEKESAPPPLPPVTASDASPSPDKLQLDSEPSVDKPQLDTVSENPNIPPSESVVGESQQTAGDLFTEADLADV